MTQLVPQLKAWNVMSWKIAKPLHKEISCDNIPLRDQCFDCFLNHGYASSAVCADICHFHGCHSTI